MTPTGMFCETCHLLSLSVQALSPVIFFNLSKRIKSLECDLCRFVLQAYFDIVHAQWTLLGKVHVMTYTLVSLSRAFVSETTDGGPTSVVL